MISDLRKHECTGFNQGEAVKGDELWRYEKGRCQLTEPVPEPMSGLIVITSPPWQPRHNTSSSLGWQRVSHHRTTAVVWNLLICGLMLFYQLEMTCPLALLSLSYICTHPSDPEQILPSSENPAWFPLQFPVLQDRDEPAGYFYHRLYLFCHHHFPLCFPSRMWAPEGRDFVIMCFVS